MGWFSGFVVFVIIWWCVFFITLPWGAQPLEKPEIGHAESAPAKPRVGIKAAVTTLISLVLWAIAYWVIESDLISFRQG